MRNISGKLLVSFRPCFQLSSYCGLLIAPCVLLMLMCIETANRQVGDEIIVMMNEYDSILFLISSFSIVFLCLYKMFRHIYIHIYICWSIYRYNIQINILNALFQHEENPQTSVNRLVTKHKNKN